MNEESLFLAALERTNPAERHAFLHAACAGDKTLRERIEKLLAAADRPRGILERGQDAGARAPAQPESFLAADRLFAGRYKLREKLGEGGMGEVWVADQIEPVQRRVALKVVRIGHDTARMLARFDQERQALALMDHPNIAKVLDAGVDEAGRPFFVMELIKGVSITNYCDAAMLKPRQRLELFISVCHAVQHAHQKGIIHRDLKPSNIIVGFYDDLPVPKIIDFGVAKATGSQITDKSIYTEIGALIGTLEYMSPEQAEPNNIDIDTRTDIYALGAVLYELLTGSVPFSRKELRAGAFVEMLRIIKEVEPATPSAKLSGSGTLANIAAVRQTEPRKLIALIRGDLDWIIIKCLEKSRSRRYETANALATDLQHYLCSEPVSAAAPSTAYRLRKFVRRNRGTVSVAAMILLLLSGGIVGTSIGFVRAERARDAESQRAEGEREAKQSAEKRLLQVEKGIDLVGSIFEDLDPQAEEKEGRPLRAILGDRLDRAAADLAGEGVGDPLLVARLQDRLGRTYLGLGHAGKAEPLFAKAVATRQSLLGADDPLTLRSMTGQAKALHGSGKPQEAIKLLEQVREVQTNNFGIDSLDTLATMNELGSVYSITGEALKSIAILEQVRDGRVKQLGENDDATLDTFQALAFAYVTAKRFPEAIALAEKVLAAQVKKYGDDHPRSLTALNNLARVYRGSYKMRQALALFEQARDAIVPKLGPLHPQTLAILHNLVYSYRAFKRTADAIALGEMLRERRIMVQGSLHPATLDTLYVLALAYQDDDKLEKALPLFEQAVAGIEKLEFKQVNAVTMIDALCDCQEKLGQFDRAEPWRRKCLELLRNSGPMQLVEYVDELRDLGANLLNQEKYIGAEPVLRECLALLQKDPVQAFAVFDTQSMIGGALAGQKKFDEAEPLLLQGYRGMKTMGNNPGQLHHGHPPAQLRFEALERLVRLYDSWGKKDEAEKWRKESDGAKTIQPPERE